MRKHKAYFIPALIISFFLAALYGYNYGCGNAAETNVASTTSTTTLETTSTTTTTTTTSTTTTTTTSSTTTTTTTTTTVTTTTVMVQGSVHRGSAPTGEAAIVFLTKEMGTSPDKPKAVSATITLSSEITAFTLATSETGNFYVWVFYPAINPAYVGTKGDKSLSQPVYLDAANPFGLIPLITLEAYP